MKRRIQMKSDSTDTTLSGAFEQFIKSCKIKNLSPKTIETYEVHFKIFSMYFPNSNSVSDFDRNTVDGYILYLKDKGTVKDITINTYLRSLRVFAGYMSENSFIPPVKVTMLKVNKDIKETYSDDELQRLLKKPNVKRCDFTEYKTWVFSNFLLGTGMRISSALNVRIKDIDFGNLLITVTKTKNRKAQIMPLASSLCSILTEYLQYRQGNEEDYVFCNSTGGQGNIHTYQGILQRYNRSRGVEKTSAHLYRHSFAKNFILAGGDVFRLKNLLNHSDLTIVNNYVQLWGNDLSKDYDKSNPLEQFTKNHSKLQGIKMR